MKIPFVGGSSEARSPNASIQRTVNCFLEYDQSNPRVPVALYGTPGLILRAQLGSGPVRGGIRMGSVSYWVSGNSVYQVTSNNAVLCGTIATSSGQVGVATNGTQVLIVDGSGGWLASGTSLAQITDVDFPNGVTQATYQDGYFIVTGIAGSQAFWWNETPGNGSAWNGLDFASAEGSPDDCINCLSDHRELWLVGTQSIQIYNNTGDASALFAPSGNTFLEVGTLAAASFKAMNNSVYWLGAAKDGQGVIYRAEGYNPVRISTHALERALAGYATLADAYAFTFQLQGHWFYALHFPTANKSWLYDAASPDPNNAWTEWVWRDPSDNTENRHRASCCVFFDGDQWVGDWENGNLYTLDLDTYTDNGDPILRMRRTQTMSDERERLFFEELIIDMETGVGTASGDGSDPMLMLRYSNDSGHSWSGYKQASVGQAGQYTKRVKFGPTGNARDRVWELTFTEPCRFALFGAYARVSKGA